jgi:hypothetical protein
MRFFCAPFSKAMLRLSLALTAMVAPAACIPPTYATQQAASGDASATPQESPPPQYDKTIFPDPVPSDQLAFLSALAGTPSGAVEKNKQFGKLLHAVVPDCVFHYGWDMGLQKSLETVLKGSSELVQVRDGRYAMISGRSGPYLQGRGFLWLDLQEGIALGGFYFHPTNGEPTPTVTIFSKQVSEAALEMNQLPPDFAADLSRWSEENNVPPVTTRYFITAAKEKIVLQHDEDYCVPTDGTNPPPENICEQMNADAADIDVSAAYYLDQVHHATNATAWMINGPDQLAWIQVRNTTCGVNPDPLHCRIIMARERTRVIITRHPLPSRIPPRAPRT